VEAKPKPGFPDFRKGTVTDFNQLASLRQISREGVEWAGERGLLWFATLKDCPAWIVTDMARVNAQARRMDGQQWEHLEAEGMDAARFMGIVAPWHHRSPTLSGHRPVRRRAGFLAAHYLALWEQSTHYTKRDVQCAPVAMLGASQRIHPDALPMFAGKRVRIFGHDDEAGRAAVERWARATGIRGADVDAFSFAGLRQ
jgi:hypothetical protein